MTDDEELRRTRAARLREKIDEVLRGEKPPRPRSPREFTDAKAREAAEEARREAAEEERREDAEPEAEAAAEEEAEEEPADSGEDDSSPSQWERQDDARE